MALKVSVKHKNWTFYKNTLLSSFIFLSFTNIFPSIPFEFFPFSDLQNHPNAQISNPSQIVKLFTFQIEPIHHSNPDTTKNKERKSRTKGRERKRRATAIEVVVVVPVSTANRKGGEAQGFGLG